MDTDTQKLTSGPPVSICMLTYNRAHYLKAAINSVIAQTYTNWELILIDDGSTDGTETAVTAFKDSRIKYIKHEINKGLHVRRTESLTHASGTYIAVLDSDDLWHSTEKLSRQVAFLESNSDCSIVGTFVQLIDSNGNKIGTTAYGVTDAEIRNHILIRNQFTHSSVLMRKRMLDKTNGYQPTLAEDLELFLQLGILGKFANIPEYLTSHRLHNQSANDHGIKMAKAVHSIIQKHRKEYPNYIIALIKSYLRVLKGYLL